MVSRFQSFGINGLEVVDQNGASWNPLRSAGCASLITSGELPSANPPRVAEAN